ncbi:GNAT family N-acetyltransferase [Streptococcus caballi]|uniref:GNAT family N-acetyltransferase n=1 Tax=Streptococcus caballi TaxID=439220 RepID=UPI0003710C78|nr:GNAT family N-acetyltransferase [Streptococcus caballi]
MIRPMELADIDQVVALENTVWTSHNTPATLPVASRDKIIQCFEDNTHFLIAQEDDQIVGVLDYHPYYPFTNGRHVVTFGIAIENGWRRKGIGQQLWQAFLEEIKGDYRKVVIHVLSSNQEALSFYQKLGFRQEGCLKKQFFLDDHYADDLIYSYDLEDNYAT